MSINVLKVCKPGYIGPANLMVVTLEDHEAEVAQLNAENESLRKDARLLNILVEAMAEVKATSDGESDQPIADIVSGCLAEIAAISSPENPS